MPSPLRSCDYRTHEPDDSLHTVEVALLLAPLLAPLLLRALLLLLALLLPKCVSEKIDRMAPRMMAAAGGEARPNGIFGTEAATSGEARLCGMLRAMV